MSRGKLTDESEMPFGKYKGERMRDVPPDYLHWLWVNGLREKTDFGVGEYIKDNINVLSEEHSDGIW